MIKFTFIIALFVMSVANFGKSQDPLYPHNAVDCERCHSTPQKFGSSGMIVQRAGISDQRTFVPVAEGGIHHRIGESIENGGAGMRITGNRVSLSILGDGFIEAISDEDITENYERQNRQGQGVTGKAVWAPVLEAHSRAEVLRVGRFGWKGQHGSLLSSCADSLRNELGIRNRLYPDEYATHAASADPTPFDSYDPSIGTTELDRMVDEIRRTSPPSRDEKVSMTAIAQQGELLFSHIGCSDCHVPTYKTLPLGSVINGGTYRVPKFLGSKVVHPYSDFLLHDIGTGDGIPQAAKPEFLDQSTANKFRTPPLWGLRFRAAFLMHDGDTPSLDAAIRRHAGEATKIRERYEKLSPEQKQELLTFLKSL